jgi:hypothetical protein
LGDGGEALGQFDAGARLDGAGEPADHDVEDTDLVVAHAGGAADEKIRQTHQDLDALVAGTARHRRL